ncbi:GH92 family glycosyl hydrolase, partial [Clostridium sp.]|uniref:GH92 family glycosyl hydrolase n=1 Tax=Clostridium sp. TaxID=1506 RepID=UPI003F3A99B3
GKIYVNNGFWDTYRTTWAAYTLFTPEKNTEMLNGLVQHYDDQGWVPRWIAPGGTNSMVGTSSDIIFGDAMNKEVDFNAENAFKSALKNASVVSPNLTNGGRARVQTSVFDGYVPAEQHEGFSWAMEGYLNDYGIYQMAEKLGKTDEAIYYKNRSLNYTKLFSDYDGGWFRGKKANGEWRTTDEAFNPIKWGDDYTETNAWNMAFSVVHDGQGLANLYGGREALGAKLDQFFTTDGNFNPGGYGGVIHEMLEAREVKLGQYGHSNQPSHHIPYMYNYAAQPWKAQAVVRDILARCYVGSEFGQGYIGDEDNGEMSAWYIFSALGFYPVSVGNDEYAIGSPLFKKATIHLENGKDIVINAPNNSKENVYIQSMTLNGEDYNKSYIKHDDIKDGAEITFNLGNTPNTNWGTAEDSLPTSITEGDEVATPMDDFSKKDVAIGTEQPKVVLGDTAYGTDGDVSKLFNNNSSDEATVSTLYYTFAEPKYVELYTLTSSRNNLEAPKNFTLSASNNGEDWVVLDERSNEVFDWAQYTRPFAISQDKVKKYTHYKLEMTGGNKLSEVELMGYSNKKDIEEEIVVSKVNNLKAKNIDKNNIELGWEAPESTIGLEGYNIYKDGKLLTTLDNNTLTYKAEGLKANTIYGFKVTAKYSNGEESKPQSVNIRTIK